MEPIILKQNNIISLSCALSEPISGVPILSAIKQNGVKYPMIVNIVDALNFVVIIDTSSLVEGGAKMDIKAGNVSSDTIGLIIEEDIS